MVSMGYDMEGKQIRKTTTFTPPDGVTEGKAEKLARAYAYLYFSKCFTAEFHIARQHGHDGTQGSTCLRGLDSGIRHQIDCFSGVLNGETQRTCNRGGILEGFAHHRHIGVGVTGCRCQHISKMTAVGTPNI